MFIIISGNFIDQITFSHVLTKLIVCLTGMPGAGKSTIADGLNQKVMKLSTWETQLEKKQSAET